MRSKKSQLEKEKIKVITELHSLIKTCFGDNIETTEIRFDDSHLKINGKTVRQLSIMTEITTDVFIYYVGDDTPHCACFEFSINKINKIIDDVKNIKDYYNSHKTPK